MITNYTCSIPESDVMLEELKKSKFQFTLTGSRLFGGVTPESDFDFFTAHSLEVEEFLISRGFLEIKGDPNYITSDTHKIYRRSFPKGPGIDVQLLKDDFDGTYARKVGVNNQLLALSRCGIIDFSRLSKGQRTKLWEILL